MKSLREGERDGGKGDGGFSFLFVSFSFSFFLKDDFGKKRREESIFSNIPTK